MKHTYLCLEIPGKKSLKKNALSRYLSTIECEFTSIDLSDFTMSAWTHINFAEANK